MQIVSLFSGCGGLDLGFTQANFNIIWANEYNNKIWETYEGNHPDIKLDKRNILNVSDKEIPDCDGIIGGPPCQSWSLAGNMKGMNDKRGELFKEYIRILKNKKPKFFLAENVPGIISKRHISEFKKIIKKLEKIGYKISYKKINAANYGVPQSRKRVFIIGYRSDLGINFNFPKSNKKNITLKEAIGDLSEPLPAKDKNYTNGNDNLKVNAHEYYTGSFSSRYMSRNRRRGWNEVAYTIQASGRHARIHPSAGKMKKIKKDNWKFDETKPIRRLSVRESARIQTFPDKFKFYYKKINTGYKMVGNAVPVKLARVLAEKIKNDLKDNGTLIQ